MRVGQRAAFDDRLKRCAYGNRVLLYFRNALIWLLYGHPGILGYLRFCEIFRAHAPIDKTLAERQHLVAMNNRTPALVALYTIAALGVILLWFGAYGPIWRAGWSAQPADWLGFAGNVVAGLMTLSAAAVAFLAVRMQVRSDQEIASRGHRQAMRATKIALCPLFECLDVLRTVFDETLAFVGTDDEQLSRTT